jgi:putative transposase
MSKLFHPLLVLIASATEQELARHVQYLKEENRILRDKLPKRLPLTDQERRRLVKFGKPLGSAIKELITIVTPRTFARWLATETGVKPKPKKAGRPRTAEEIRELILKLARETGWGYSRLHGELKKLGIRSVSRGTIVNILREHGIEPAPNRGPGTWDEFLKRHAKTLYACDFFTKKVVTMRGIVEMYLLVFIHIGSRKIWVSRATEHPDGQWVAQQARNVCMHFQDQDEPPKYLIRDRDTKFTQQFDQIIKAEGVKPVKLPPKSPNLNAHCERVVQTLQHEALDHFVVFGEDHLNHIVSEFVRYYHKFRPHQGLDNVPLTGPAPPEESDLADPDEVVRHEWLGGLLKHYERRAA